MSVSNETMLRCSNFSDVIPSKKLLDLGPVTMKRLIGYATFCAPPQKISAYASFSMGNRALLAVLVNYWDRHALLMARIV